MVPDDVKAVGMDVLPAMALGLAAVYQNARGRMKTAGLLCGLAVLTRPDLVLVPGLILLDNRARETAVVPAGAVLEG